MLWRSRCFVYTQVAALVGDVGLAMIVGKVAEVDVVNDDIEAKEIIAREVHIVYLGIEGLTL